MISSLALTCSSLSRAIITCTFLCFFSLSFPSLHRRRWRRRRDRVAIRARASETWRGDVRVAWRRNRVVWLLVERLVLLLLEVVLLLLPEPRRGRRRKSLTVTLHLRSIRRRRRNWGGREARRGRRNTLLTRE